MLTRTKNNLLLNLKNLIGWKTKRKIIVFAVDDYGNVRVDSKRALKKMASSGLKVHTRFDAYDSLETRIDLEALYGTLNSVKDYRGHPAVFTPFALPCNINFERLRSENYSSYQYELLPKTYQKLTANYPDAYSGAWGLWKEGIERRLLRPQFHGREHLNIKVFEEKLAKQDKEMITALQNRSYTSISSTGYPTIRYTAAFSFWSPDELQKFPEILKTGLQAFESVFGYEAKVFTPPAQQFHKSLEPVLWENGIKAIDKPLVSKIHEGLGKYHREWSSTGYDTATGTTTLVRNVVFEPTDERGVDWVTYTLKQIEAAFRWNRPAIISSHRVNFCGHIDPNNRKKGLVALRQLLKGIVQRWPEVEFLAADELVDLIMKKAKK